MEGSRKLHQGLGVRGPHARVSHSQIDNETQSEPPVESLPRGVRIDPAQQPTPHVSTRPVLTFTTEPDLVSLCSWF